MTFTPQDLWLMARAVNGFDLPASAPDGCTTEGQRIAFNLALINWKDRELVLSRQVPASVMKAVMKLDPDMPAPAASAGHDAPFEIVRADDLHKLPPLKWLIPGEIVEGGMCVLYGESGVGKSFIALDYAMRIAADGATVVYAPTEGEGGYRKRVEAWKSHHHKPSVPSLHFIFGGVALHDEKLMGLLKPELKRLSPRLMIIDTLAMGMVGLDENSARDVGIFMSACRRLMREMGTALLLVHHTSKAGVMERGSTALRGNADTMIKLSNADDLILMECSKTKDEARFPSRYIQMVTVGESLIPLPADKVIRDDSLLTPNQRSLLDMLALEVNREGVSLRDAAESTGVSLGSTQRALSNLIRKGYAEKNGGFRITPNGLNAIGVESGDPKAESGNRRKTAPHDLVESAESSNSGFDQGQTNGDARFTGSTDSAGSETPALPGFDKPPSKRRATHSYTEGA